SSSSSSSSSASASSSSASASSSSAAASSSSAAASSSSTAASSSSAWSSDMSSSPPGGVRSALLSVSSEPTLHARHASVVTNTAVLAKHPGVVEARFMESSLTFVWRRWQRPRSGTLSHKK
ncbi:MAG: hypothetical protein B7733_01670, partial [Myxococcales bacterium FL481]